MSIARKRLAGPGLSSLLKKRTEITSGQFPEGIKTAADVVRLFSVDPATQSGGLRRFVGRVLMLLSAAE